jgi:murein DD-endopeptidase MepM/ murein hydrolase activator NlpD
MTESGGVLLSNKPGKNSGNPGKNTNTVAPTTPTITPPTVGSQNNGVTYYNGQAYPPSTQKPNEYGYIWPLKGDATSKGSFGPDPGHPTHLHRGEDFPAKEGTLVYVINDGTVLTTNENANDPRGKYVYVSHGDGSFTVYQHLHTIMVKQKTNLNTGQVIGTVGNTGTSSYGSHLHIEIIKNPPSGYESGSKPYFGDPADTELKYHLDPNLYLPTSGNR